MRSVLFCSALAVILAACGGGGSLPPPRHVPTVTLVSPAESSTLTGEVTIEAKATGDGIGIRSFEVIEPAQLGGSATVTFDAPTHSATLAIVVRTLNLPNGQLRILLRAIDEKSGATDEDYTFVVDSEARVVSLDASYPSYRTEANMTVSTTGGIANVGGFLYASSDKVAASTSVHKVVTRMGWPDGSPPTVANLEGTNDYNIPVLRMSVPHEPGDPALASAQATVGVGEDHAGAVTIDLWPASASPAGQQVYLLPLSSNLFPFLTELTGPTQLTITASVKDAVNHEWRANGPGGSWAVTMNPLSPPVVVTVDAGYTSAADAKSVFAYPLGGGAYAGLWTGDFSSEAGVRVRRIIVTNPDPANEVALAANLGTSTWRLDESWTANDTTTRTQDYTYSCTVSSSSGSCGGSRGPCDVSGATPVYYQPVGSTRWSCAAASYADGPAALPLARSGDLSVIGYKDGTSTAADRSGARFRVPAATQDRPGRLDLYVLRPVTSDRSDGLPLAWVSASSRFEAGTSFKTQTQGSCRTFGTSGVGTYGTTCTWAEKQWNWRLASAVESIQGSLVLEGRAYDTAEYGPSAAAGSALPLSATIRH